MVHYLSLSPPGTEDGTKRMILVRTRMSVTVSDSSWNQLTDICNILQAASSQQSDNSQELREYP